MPFDKPVLSDVEGLSANGWKHSIGPLALSLSKCTPAAADTLKPFVLSLSKHEPAGG